MRQTILFCFCILSLFGCGVFGGGGGDHHDDKNFIDNSDYYCLPYTYPRIVINLENGVELTFRNDKNNFTKYFTIDYLSKITKASIKFCTTYDSVEVTSDTKFALSSIIAVHNFVIYILLQVVLLREERCK